MRRDIDIHTHVHVPIPSVIFTATKAICYRIQKQLKNDRLQMIETRRVQRLQSSAFGCNAEINSKLILTVHFSKLNVLRSVLRFGVHTVRRVVRAVSTIRAIHGLVGCPAHIQHRHTNLRTSD